MASGTRSTKDKEMAAYLKKMGIRRTSAACPICHKVFSLNKLQAHIAFHK